MALLQHPLPGYPTPTNGGFGAPRGVIAGVDYGRHRGHDWSAPTGTPVRAAGVGVVTHVGGLTCPYHIGAGHHVIIDHGNGLETRYVHMSAKYVFRNQGVVAGQAIGAVGATGTATGPHLHFEVLANGVHVDPLPYLGLAPARSSSGVTTGADQCPPTGPMPETWTNHSGQGLPRCVPRAKDNSCPPGYHPRGGVTIGPIETGLGLIGPDEGTYCDRQATADQASLGNIFTLALPPLLEPALSIAIVGGAGLLVFVGVQRVLTGR